MSFDLLSLISTTGRLSPPSTCPVVGLHRLEWREDTWSGMGWQGVPPEPDGVALLDVGDADMLTEEGYAEACRLAGGRAVVLVVGSGEAVASLRRCLEGYRKQAAA